MRVIEVQLSIGSCQHVEVPDDLRFLSIVKNGPNITLLAVDAYEGYSGNAFYDKTVKIFCYKSGCDSLEKSDGHYLGSVIVDNELYHYFGDLRRWSH